MATWHQQRAMTPLWHETKWTVVEDSIGRTTSVSRWETAEAANEHAKTVNGYVIPPTLCCGKNE